MKNNYHKPNECPYHSRTRVEPKRIYICVSKPSSVTYVQLAPSQTKQMSEKIVNKSSAMKSHKTKQSALNQADVTDHIESLAWESHPLKEVNMNPSSLTLTKKLCVSPFRTAQQCEKTTTTMQIQAQILARVPSTLVGKHSSMLVERLTSFSLYRHLPH